MDKNFTFFSDNIEISELNNGDLLAKFCISSFDINKNGKKIDIDNFDKWKDTLVNMPLVGKVAKIGKTNEEDFTSHNKKTKYEKVGNEIKTVTYLDTDAFGVFNSCYIEEVEGKPFIMAECQIWGSRFKNVKNIILSKLERGETVSSSWELVITDSEMKTDNGVSYELIKDGYFLGHCLLGRNPRTGAIVSPAYDCSRILEVAEEDPFNEELSSAIAQDINNLKEGGDGMEKEKESMETEVSEGQIEVSALTLGDIRRKVCQLAWELEREEDYWLYDSIIYPLENTAYFKKEGAEELDDDYLKVVYSVGENNEVSLVSKENVKMTFVPKESVVEVSEIEGVRAELSEKVDSIVKLGETLAEKEALISEKDKTIAELEVFKETVAEIEKEKAEAELEKKRKACSEAALSSGYITEADIEASEEMKQAIAEADMDKVKLFIAEAVLKNVVKTEVSEEKTENTKEIEVSTDLNSSSNYEYSGESGNPILDFIRKPNKRR